PPGSATAVASCRRFRPGPRPRWQSETVAWTILRGRSGIASSRTASDPGDAREPAVLPDGIFAIPLRTPWLLAKYVDVRPAPCAQSATPRWSGANLSGAG